MSGVVPLAQLTTMRVGGVPKEIVRCENSQQLYEEISNSIKNHEPFHVLAGGSNTVFADELSELKVIHIVSKGVDVLRESDAEVVLRVQAGEDWDEFVSWCIERGYAGIEAMSGIPGSVGATPVQNVGAYGQEVSQVIVAAEFFDYETLKSELKPASFFCFAYRDSALKHGVRGVIGFVDFRLKKLGGLSVAMASGQITNHLNAEYGSQLSLKTVRETVLTLRSQKGMVVSQDDPNSVSCGSFFTNPVVSHAKSLEFPKEMQMWNMEDGQVKLSAAWLIENAGIEKGFSLPFSKAAISAKHTLAIINRGGATSTEILELARYVQERVAARWGINLIPEPNLIGF
jgi:UDP-N-acetylmuramate dehydrogenase